MSRKSCNVITDTRRELSTNIFRTANLDDEYDSDVDEETSSYVNKEVEEAEKRGDREPLGRPNSFLNRMISHGNKKTEDEIARDAAELEKSRQTKLNAVSSGQTMGAAQGMSAGK